MILSSLFQRLRNLLLHPGSEWDTIQKEKQNARTLFYVWIIPLALIMGLAGVLGGLIFSFGKSMSHHFMASIFSFILSLLAVILSSIIVKILASSYSSENRFDEAFRLVAYSYSPSFIANAIAFLIPPLYFISLFGLYGFYLMWVGMGPILHTPSDKKASYFVLIIVALVTAYVLFAILLSSLINNYPDIPSAQIRTI